MAWRKLFNKSIVFVDIAVHSVVVLKLLQMVCRRRTTSLQHSSTHSTNHARTRDVRNTICLHWLQWVPVYVAQGQASAVARSRANSGRRFLRLDHALPTWTIHLTCRRLMQQRLTFNPHRHRSSKRVPKSPRNRSEQIRA